jgi:hypothetical protein
MGAHYAYQQAPVVQSHGYSSSAYNGYNYPAYSTAPTTSSMSSMAVVSHPAPQLHSECY